MRPVHVLVFGLPLAYARYRPLGQQHGSRYDESNDVLEPLNPLHSDNADEPLLLQPSRSHPLADPTWHANPMFEDQHHEAEQSGRTGQHRLAHGLADLDHKDDSDKSYPAFHHDIDGVASVDHSHGSHHHDHGNENAHEHEHEHHDNRQSHGQGEICRLVRRLPTSKEAYNLAKKCLYSCRKPDTLKNIGVVAACSVLLGIAGTTLATYGFQQGIEAAQKIALKDPTWDPNMIGPINGDVFPHTSEYKYGLKYSVVNPQHPWLSALQPGRSGFVRVGPGQKLNLWQPSLLGEGRGLSKRHRLSIPSEKPLPLSASSDYQNRRPGAKHIEGDKPDAETVTLAKTCAKDSSLPQCSYDDKGNQTPM